MTHHRDLVPASAETIEWGVVDATGRFYPARDRVARSSAEEGLARVRGDAAVSNLGPFSLARRTIGAPEIIEDE